MILSLVEQAQSNGVRLEPACARLGVSARTVQRWRESETGEDRRSGPNKVPANRLTDAERRAVIAVANSEEFREMSPKQIVPQLADRGVYLASESSFYRLLREAGQMVHRGRAKPPVKRARAEHLALLRQPSFEEKARSSRALTNIVPQYNML
jgi:putative transposase